MNKIRTLLKAPLLTQSGYGIHSRQIFRALFSDPKFDIFVESLKWGNCSYLTEDTDERKAIRECIHKFRVAKKQKQDSFDLFIHVTIPNEFEKLGKINVGVTAGIETDRISHVWVQKCNEMDIIIVPSEHSKKVIETTIIDWENSDTGDKGTFKVEKPVVVCHEGVDTSIFTKLDKLYDNSIKDMDFGCDFNFLHIGQWGKGGYGEDRKNISLMIKYFIETFRGRKDIGLVLKINMSRNNATDFDAVQKRISQIKTNYNPKEIPPIRLVHGNLTSEELSNLYNHPQIKAFVSFTHGEGFGLPLLESAACDLPVIATNWSGHLDFLEKKKFTAVNYELKEIPEVAVWDPIMIKGSQWAEVKSAKAKEAFRKTQHGHVPKKWAKELGKNVRENFDINVTCDEFLDVLNQTLILKSGKPGPAVASENPVEFLKALVDTPEDYNVLYTMPRSNGDVFISSAVIDGLMKEVRKQQPEAKLYFATQNQYKDILEDNPNVHKVIEWQNFMINVEISENVFDLVLTPDVTTQYTFSNWTRRGQGRLLAEEFANHCQASLGEYFIKTTKPKETLPEKYVTFHPGSGKGRWEARKYTDWPEVLRNINLKFPEIQIVQVGAEDEPEFDVELDLRGKTNIHELAYVIEHSSMHLSIDTISMHMAAAFDVPTLSIFGCSYAQSTGPWVPNKDESKLILLESERKTCGCSRACYKDKPVVNTNGYAPINEIDPMMVVQGAAALLQGQFQMSEAAYERVTSKISGYTTTYNIKGYPYIESIKSMLGFCDEVVVVDGCSTDGTWETLQKFAKEDERIKLYQNFWDPEEPGMDGMQKAYARAFCDAENEFLWQQDCDEVVHEDDYEKIKLITKRFPVESDILHLPIAELWGDGQTVTGRRHSWKWRLSKNKPEITHGINKHARLTNEKTGKVYAKQGMSDGCEYINVMTNEMLSHTGFYLQNRQIEATRLGSPEDYANIMNQVFTTLPSVYHYSWASLPRKIKNFTEKWNKQWNVLYQTDNVERFPGVKTKAQIKKLAKVLYEEGGEKEDAIKYKFALQKKGPAIMEEWLSNVE